MGNEVVAFMGGCGGGGLSFGTKKICKYKKCNGVAMQRQSAGMLHTVCSI